MENPIILDIYRIATPALLGMCMFFLVRIIKKVDWLGRFINELNVNLQQVNVLCPQKHHEIDLRLSEQKEKIDDHDEKLEAHEKKINALEVKTAINERNISTLQGKRPRP